MDILVGSTFYFIDYFHFFDRCQSGLLAVLEAILALHSRKTRYPTIEK